MNFKPIPCLHPTIKFVLLFFILFGVNYKIQASHLLATTLSYEHVNGDTFLIKATIYRDCTGPVGVGEVGLTVKSKSNNLLWSATHPYTLSTGIDITPTCDSIGSPCNNANVSFFGIEEYYLESKIVLPAITCEFVISLEECCRSANITTGAAHENYYTEIKLNRCAPAGNSSPVFITQPFILGCVNQCTTILQGAIGGKDDSLVHKFAAPLRAQGDPISYVTGYNFDEPFQYAAYPDKNKPYSPPKCEGFHLNSATGESNFKATKAEVTVFAIEVEQWRKDALGTPVLIGTSRKDVLMNFITCPTNRAPIMVDNINTTELNVCAKMPVAFNVSTFDIDSTDTVMVSWAHNISGAVIIDSVKKWSKGYFSWTPDTHQVSPDPYWLVVRAEDNACPLPSYTEKIYKIFVHPAVPDFSITKQRQACKSNYLFAANSNKHNKDYEFEWYINDKLSSKDSLFTHRFIKPGKHFIKLAVTSANGCKIDFIDSLDVPDDYLWVELPADSAVCINSTININAVKHNGTADYYYNWSTDGNGIWAKNKTSITAQITRDTIIKVKIKDASGCENTDSIFIHAQKYPKPLLGPDSRQCNIEGKSFTLKNKDTSIKAKNISWFQMDSTGNTSTFLSDSIELAINNSGTYWIQVTDSVGCSGADTVKITFNPLVPDIIPQNVKGCDGDSITLVASINTGNNLSWKWEDTRYLHLNRPPLSTKSSYRLLAKGKAGTVFPMTYRVTVTQVQNGLTCQEMDYINLEIYTKPIVNPGNLLSQCVDYGPYDLNQVNSSPAGGLWSFRKNPSAISGNILYPNLLGTGKHYLHYTYMDSLSGCNGMDSSLITIDALPHVTAGNDVTLCNGDNIFSLLGSPVGGAWTALDTSKKGLITTPAFAFDPSLSGAGTFNLIYKYKSKNITQCDDEDTLTITVHPKLIVDAGNYETQCFGTKELPLGGTPQLGIWNSNNPGSISQDLTGKYHFSPSTAGAGIHKLWYTASYAQGACPETDTVYITVDSNCVWPGDANLDKTADYLDVLDIALGFSSTGTSRANASINWEPQPSKDWDSTLLSGTNYKHLDTNGDSTINADDTLAVSLNYGKTHAKDKTPQASGNPNDPPLYFQFAKDTFYAGEVVEAELRLGKDEKPVNNTLGAAVSFEYTTPYADASTYDLDLYCDAICGSSSDYLTFKKVFAGEGFVDATIVRTDRKTVSVNGKLADISFRLQDTSAFQNNIGKWIYLTINNAKVIDNKGAAINIYTVNDSALVFRKNTSIKQAQSILQDIHIYPNPTSTNITIACGRPVNGEIYITNILGQVIYQERLQNQQTKTIDVKHFPAGIYMVQLKAGNNISNNKIIITR